MATGVTEGERNFINRSVASITALKSVSVSPRRDGSVIKITGIAPDAGFFVWDAASTDTADDNLIVLPTGHIGAGRWIRLSYERASIIVNGKPKIIDILQGTDGGATNDALITSDYFNEHPSVAETAIKHEISVTSNGQTAFPDELPFEPSSDATVSVTYNGVEYKQNGTDYTYSGKDFTWLEPNDIELQSGDILIVQYNHLGNGSRDDNVTEHGLIFEGYFNGSDWISKNVNGNYIQYVDNTQPTEPVLITATIKNIASGSVIDLANDLNIVSKTPLRGAGYSVPYGGLTKPIYTIPFYSFLSLVRSGSTATISLNVGGGDVRNHKKVGDTVWVFSADQTEYNGVHIITGLPSANQIEYTVSGTPATPATNANARLTYNPQPNQNGWCLENSEEELYVFLDNVNLPVGFHQTITRRVSQQFKTWIPSGQEVSGIRQINPGDVGGILWTNSSTKHPILFYQYSSVQVRKWAANKWIMEFERVGEGNKVA